MKRMEQGAWSKASRKQYNMQDAVSRSTTEVITVYILLLVSSIINRASKFVVFVK